MTYINIKERIAQLRSQHPLELIDVARTVLTTLKFRYIFKCAANNAIVGFNSKIINFSRVSIGKGCFIQDHVYLRAGASGHVKLKENVAINSFAMIFGHGGVEIGAYSQIGPGVLITTTGHDFHNAMQTHYQPVRIGEWCWIGGKCTILPNVTIGNGAVVGAGSVVTKDIPDNCLAVGVPAKVIRHLR